MAWSENWLIMALLVPAFWAVACLIDVCLVGNQSYRKPIDGAIVSCLLCAIPAVFILYWIPGSADTFTNAKKIPVSAVFAGVCYAIHVFFYFRILFRLNDVSGAETFLSLSVLIVPFLAWTLLDEVLPVQFYLAFTLAAIGVALHCYPVLRKMGCSLLLDMIVCLLTISLSMVLQTKALDNYGFADSILAFNVSCLLIAVLTIVCSSQTQSRIFTLFRKCPALLFLAEFLSVTAVVCSHRAMQTGPSVSFVALIECLLPVVIICFSSVLLLLNRFKRMLSVSVSNSLTLQVQATPTKVIAFCLVIFSTSVIYIG